MKGECDSPRTNQPGKRERAFKGFTCKQKAEIDWLVWAGRFGVRFSQSASRPSGSVCFRVEEAYLTTSPRGQEVTFPAFHLQGCRLSHSPRGRKQDETVLAASQFLISKSPFVLLSCFPSFVFLSSLCIFCQFI